MKVYKEKQFLIFDFEDGRNVKYDFSTKTAIGIKGNRVKDLKKQLNWLSIDQLIECCEDKQYGKFLKFIKNRYKYNIYNIGTILSHVPEYEKFEQIFSAGIEDIIDYNYFNKTINEIPKSLIKLSKEKGIMISNDLCNFWKENIDAHKIAYELDYISLTNNDIYEIINKKIYRNKTGEYYSYYNNLISKYKYNAKRLLLYIDYLVTYEALNAGCAVQEIYDYATMQKCISDKYDKYPKNFLTTHKIACRNYNRLRREFPEELFKKRINKDFECTYSEYTFIYPKCTQDIKDEAVQQNNCVASYIDRVIDGKCHILFLRKKDSINKSLVTIEVDCNTRTIVQAKGKFNRDTTEEENKVIEKWNRKFSLKRMEEVA